VFRKTLALLAGAVLCCGARGAAATLIRLHATKVTFYYNQFLVEADGNVRLTTSDGMTMSGDAFSMDLKLNRFVLAGHVHLQNPSGSQDGAALSDFLDFHRIYFLPIGSEPDRWTFVDGNFANPAKGREMPGDVFNLPDLGAAKPYLYASSAVIGERTFARFGGNKVDVLNGLGAYVPTPSYYVNFSTDQHLGTNSLAGANFDATWSLAGNANSISALHFRYDTINKTYLAFEQHLSGSKAYAVFSLNPMTRPNKFWDLILSDQPSERFQVKTFTQMNTFQHGLSEPSVSSQFTIVQATQAFTQSFLQLGAQFVNYSLLANGGPPQAPNATYPAKQHPVSLNLSATTFDHRIAHLPLYERVSYGFAFQHNSYGLQSLGGETYPSVWQHNLDVQLFVPSLKLGGNPVITKNYYVNFSTDKNRLWNSVPHYVDTTNTSLSLSRQYDAHFLGFLSYSVLNTGDYYGALQNAVYPPAVPVIGGVPYPGYAAFRGFATLRTLSLDVAYTNSGNFTASILARQHRDFPAAIPGLFPTPITNVLGQEIQPASYPGEPPYDISADVRARVNDHTTIDISRGYYFNFGNRGWTPEFVIQVTQ
jgi:hypothetical protein